MIIGVVSDTHGHVQNTLKAVRALDNSDVDLIIHCGDIGSPDIIQHFAAWPTHFVFGNVDHNEIAIAQAIDDAGQFCHNRFGSLTLEGRQICFLHGDDQRKLSKCVERGEWDLVCYGHTHRAENRHVDETLVLNPGALYRAKQHTFAIVELPSLKVTSVIV